MSEKDMKARGPYPMQPVYLDEEGKARFVMNRIVRYLLDNGPIDMNELALEPFTNAEREHFAQLIGYAITGYAELHYVSDQSYGEAMDRAKTATQQPSPPPVMTVAGEEKWARWQAKVNAYQADMLRDALREEKEARKR